MKVRTRFAPSPTGDLHIGSVRTALYSWLFARHYKGEFILRIEDTDFERSKSISTDSIISGLKWLGLNWDKGPFFQSKRLQRYKNVIDFMLEKEYAYKCFCSKQTLEEDRKKQLFKGEKPRYNGKCRNLKNVLISHKNYVVRFKNPTIGQVMFNDQIRGKIIFENQELDDLIIQRSNGIPTYNFCVVIDDLDMKITHVIRGEDHINNTPRQINILKVLNAFIPSYSHVSMIFDETGQKISKRKNAIDILEYRNNGILPEALLNYIIRLGWSHGNQEIFSVVEMKKLFTLKSISKSHSIINTKKLLWLNKYYINNLSISYISICLQDFFRKKNINFKKGPNIESIITLLRSRCNTLQEMMDLSRYFYEEFKLDQIKILDTYLTLNSCIVLEKIYKNIFETSIWNDIILSKLIKNISIKLKINIREINMLIRIVITGRISSPNISTVIYLLGKEVVLSRIHKAINYIQDL